MPVLNFKGKSIVRTHHLTVPFYPLEINAKKSYVSSQTSKPSLDDHLMIHGDNLHALKALIPHYGGKIKCIYIDPPYNTGNENWKYNDKVNNPVMCRWFTENGIGKDDMERHDKWLCMMWPRLELLKVLLAEDGVIFISIDDHECYNLKSISEEIFGEGNFLADIIVQTNPRGRSLRKGIAQTHEHILIFTKSPSKDVIQEIPKPQKTIDEYNKEDKKGKFRLLRLRNSGIQFFNKETRPNLFFPIFVHPTNGKISLTHNKEYNLKVLPKDSKGKEGCWTWSKQKIKQNPDLIVGVQTNGHSDKGWRIYRKDYLPKNGGTTKAKSLWIEKSFNHEIGKEILKEIFQGEDSFDFPKSPELIKRCISLIADKNAIILDSFAGSGTTAHAVLDLNKEDGGNRKFILIECEDYANNITAERIRRVIKGIPTAKDDRLKKGLGGSFAYCTLGQEFNEENFLKCKSLPTYNVLAPYIFYTATGQALQKFKKRGDYYVGKTKNDVAIFVVYQPDKEFLRSDASALHAKREALILQTMKVEKCKRAYVFAMACFVPPEDLPQKGLVFCQMPFQIHKMLIRMLT